MRSFDVTPHGARVRKAARADGAGEVFGRRRRGNAEFLADLDLGFAFGLEVHGMSAGIDLLLRGAFVLGQIYDQDAGGRIGLDLFVPFRMGLLEVSLEKKK